MNVILKFSGKTFLKLILINIMCVVLAVSLSFIAIDVFGEEIGYTAVCTSEDGETVESYLHNYKNGEDLLKSEYEAKGFKVNTSKIKELSTASNNVLLILIQVLCLIMISAIIYPDIWHLGFRDCNAVTFKRSKEDKFKGLKIGLITIIPAILFLGFIFITKNNLLKDFPIATYRLINAFCYGFSDFIIAGKLFVSELNVLQYLGLAFLQIIIPIITTVAYILGYKNISITEKIIYKKKIQEN